MSKVKVYNLEGQEIEEISLDPEVFNIEIKPALVHQVVEAQLANARKVLADTKIRSEVRGGGRKPWRQKGTGRARQGSIRAPQWVGGGVVFGPTSERNFTKKINKKMKQRALFMTLTDKVTDNNFIVVDKMQMPEIKTKSLVKIFAKLPTKGTNSVLCVLTGKDETINKSAQNLPKFKTILADSLNVVDILKYKYLVIEKEGIKKVIATYKK